MPRITQKQHRINEQERITKLENRDLYEELLQKMSDYGWGDGWFKEDDITLEILKAEMESRLSDWLKNDGYSSVM